jgi:pilus assembly protein CpaC
MIARAALALSFAATAPAIAGSYGAPDNAPAHVVVTATDAAWVRVHWADGKTWTRTLQAGDSYRVPDRPGVMLDTGNIKALRVSVDGTEKSFVGTMGKSIVQHDLPIDARELDGAPRPQSNDAQASKIEAAPVQPEPRPITMASVAPVPAVRTPIKSARTLVAPAEIPAAPSPVVAVAPAPTAPAPAALVAVPPAPAPAAPAASTPIAAAPVVAPPPAPVASPARPQPAPARPAKAEPATIAADQRGIELEIGKGTVIQLRHAASTVFVANPAVADVQVKSPTLIYVMAKAPGETSLFASDAGDHILLQSPIRVTLNLSRLRTTLSQLLPGEPIKVDSIEGAIVLTGTVSSPAHSADAQAIAALFANQQAQQQNQGQTSTSSQNGMQFNVQSSMTPLGNNNQNGASQSSGSAQGSQNAQATPPSVINRLAVIAPNQVNLRVRVAEVARNTLRELGINWNHTSGVGGRYTFSTDNPVLLPNQFEENLLRIGLFGPAANPITAQLDAMAQEGLITTLAEPNLTAMSGQTASFLAGGEFPIPVATATSNGIPTVTIEFKKYGVAIDFVPTILDSHRISLRIRSEVSQLTQQGAIQSNGITIPAIQVRRAETSVELGSGDSFAIAGLLQNNGEHDISKIPALGDLPVLGPLFRSDRYQRQETELVVLVTPVLVQPTAVAGATPLDGLARPNDLNREVTGAPYVQTPAGSPSHGGEQVLIGPAGFQLN